jgi:hypothetical protein
MFCALRFVVGGIEGFDSHFMFCAPGLIFGGTEGVGSRFHVLRARTHFRRYRGRPIPFCAPGLVFGGAEGVGSRFHVLRSRTCFRGHVGCRVPFSCLARSDSFSTVPRASGLVFMFCDPGHDYGGTDGVGCRFHVLSMGTSFRRYRGRRFPFSCFALPNSLSMVPRNSGLIFMFCAPRLIFGGTGVRSHFHVLHFQTRFLRCRVRRLPFSCFLRPDFFSAVPRAFDPVLKLPAPEHVFGGTEGAGSRFHILRSRTLFQRY